MNSKKSLILFLLALPAVAVLLYAAGLFDPAPAEGGSAGEPMEIAPGPRGEGEVASGAEALEAHRRDQAIKAIPEPEEIDAGEILPASEGGEVPYIAPALLRMQLVDSKKRPLSRIEMRLLARTASMRRKKAWPYDFKWKMARKVSDAQGRVSFRFRPPPPCAFTLVSHERDMVPIRRTWTEIEPGSVIDLGKIVIERGGTIKGIVRNERGEPMGDGWKIRASMKDGDGGRVTRRPERSPVGGFLLEHLSEGKWELSVHLEGDAPDGADFTARPSELVEVKEGELARVEFQYTGPPVRSQIAVNIRSGKLGIYPLAKHVVLMGPGIGVKSALAEDAEKPEEAVTYGHTWKDLLFGEYTIAVRDPRFKPWRKDGVLPSLEPIRIRLEGNAAIELEVVDAKTQAPCTRYGVKIREVPEEAEGGSQEERRRMRRFLDENATTLSRTSNRPGGKAELDGLFPGDWILVVDAPDYSRAEEPVPALQPGESRKIVMKLHSGGVLAGVVFDPDGKTPLEGAAVELRPLSLDEGDEAMPQRFMRRMRSLRNDSKHGRVESDEKGGFRFENLLPGTYVIEASSSIKAENMLGFASFFTGSGSGSGLSTKLEGVHVDEGQVVGDLRLVMPPGAYFKGRVIGPPGAKYGDLNLNLSSTTSAGSGGDERMRVMVKVDERGRFDVGPLAPGPAQVECLLYSDENMESFFGGSLSEPLGEVVLAVGEPEEHEFDLRDIWPGKLEVEVLRNGKPQSGVNVILRKEGYGLEEMRQFRFGRAQAETDEKGVASFERIFAGTHPVEIDGPGWKYRSRTPAVVLPGRESRLSVAVELYKGRVRLHYSGGEIVAGGRSVGVVPEGSDISSTDWASVDEQGYVDLELMPGRYRLREGYDWGRRRRGEAPMPMVLAAEEEKEAAGEWPSFVWTAAGAVPAELTLPVAKPEPKAEEAGKEKGR